MKVQIKVIEEHGDDKKTLRAIVTKVGKNGIEDGEKAILEGDRLSIDATIVEGERLTVFEEVKTVYDAEQKAAVLEGKETWRLRHEADPKDRAEREAAQWGQAAKERPDHPKMQPSATMGAPPKGEKHDDKVLTPPPVKK